MGAIKIAIKITNIPTYQTLKLMKGDWQIGEAAARHISSLHSEMISLKH